MADRAPIFEKSTRLKIVSLDAKDRPTGGGTTTWELPKTGILAAIHIPIPTATVAGSLSAPNAGGAASIIKRIVVRVNSGHNIWDVSGIGYNWLFRDFIGDHEDLLSYNTSRNAVTATTFNLSTILPISMNMREQIGYLMLQNEATQVTLQIDWEADATVATGATVTVAGVTPQIVIFEVPSNPASLPNLTLLHQVLEEQQTISGTGTPIDYNIPRGAMVTGLYSLTPTWTTSQFVLQQSNVIESHVPESMRLRYSMTNGRDANLSGGAITGTNRRTLYDFAGTDGFGEYGTFRDVVDSSLLTSLILRNNYSATGTAYHVRRQILKLGA